MKENRWLVNLNKNDFENNSVMFPKRFLEQLDNAASWAGWWYGDKNHYQDTRIYTWKQIHEIGMRLAQIQEEKRKKWLELQNEDDIE